VLLEIELDCFKLLRVVELEEDGLIVAEVWNAGVPIIFHDLDVLEILPILAIK
jgi:hypothetical protein